MEPSGSAGEGGSTGERYRFGPVVVDAIAHTLTRDGAPQAVEPKAFAVLLVLLRHAGELVARDDLLDAVWGHRHVTPGVLTRAIAQLRHVLEDDAHRPVYIQTQHALGYRFIGELAGSPLPAGDDALPESATPPAPHEQGTGPPSAAATVPAASGVQSDEEGAPSTARDTAVPGGAADDGSPTAPAAPLPAAAPALLPPPSPAGRRPRWPVRARWVVGAAAVLIAVLGVLAWRTQAPPARPGDASIAVLPFTSLSDDRDDSYFAEGLAVEMHDALAGVPGLKVAARIASDPAAQGAPDIRALGRTLGVATVLDASVRRDGARVRINARLSDTASGFTLWSDTYERDAADVFAVQSEIASEVVQSLLGVLPGEGPALSARLAPTHDLDAYDAYLKGLQQLRTGGDDARLVNAVGFFNQALAADAGFARAQAGICRAEIARFEEARDTPAFERARAACARAEQMDPTLREVSLALGELHRVRSEFAQATVQYTRALDDLSLRPAAYIGLARIQSAQGRNVQALEFFEQARRLRPGDGVIYRELGYHQYLNGDTAAAIESFRTAATLLPDDAGVWSSLGGLYLAGGDTANAAEAFERSLRIEPSYGALSNFGTLRYGQGAYAEAADLFRHAAELDPGDYRIWGNVGDALSANPVTAAEAQAPYRRAAQMAEAYVAINRTDAQALALLAWYRANLDETGSARERLAQAEALATERGEVAFLGAQTLAVIGDDAGARERLLRARQAGIPQQRLRASPHLRRLIGTGEAPGASGGISTSTSIHARADPGSPKRSSTRRDA